MRFHISLVRLLMAFAFSTVLGISQESSIPEPNPESIVYLYVRDDSYITWCNFSDKQAALLKNRIKGTFLWYEENGAGYLLKDPSVLSALDQLSRESEAIHNADPNRPKAPKRGDSYTPSEDTAAKSRENREAFESCCRQAIKTGFAIPKSRQELLELD